MQIKTKTLKTTLNRIDYTNNKIKIANNKFTFTFEDLLLEKKDNKLTLTYYINHYDYITTCIDCIDIDNNDLATIVDISEFNKIIKCIKSDTIRLSLDNAKLTINEFMISARNIDTNNEQSRYNIIGNGDYRDILTINSKQFLRLIDKVKDGISNDKEREHLFGININNNNNKLNIISSDGHTLIIASQDAEIQDCNLTIKKPLINKIIKAFSQDQDLKISQTSLNNANYIKIESNDTTLFSKLSDDYYPDYNKIFSFVGSQIVKIDKNQLLEATKQALIASQDKHNTTVFEFGDDLLKISVGKDQAIAYYKQIKIKRIDCLEQIKIGFNAKLLLRLLKAIESDMVELKLKDEVSVMVIESDDLKSLIMPVRL